MRPPTGIGTLLRESLYATRNVPPNIKGHALFQTQTSSFHSGASAVRSAARSTNPSSTFARRLTTFLTNAVFGPSRIPAARSNVAHPSTLARSAGRTFATHSGPCLRHAAVPQGAGVSLNTGTSVGLGSARQFSTGAGKSVLDNVIRNVPVWARAIGDEAMDEGKRKGKTGVSIGRFDARKIRHGIRRDARKAAGVPPKGMDKYLPKDESSAHKSGLIPTAALVTLLSIPLEPIMRASTMSVSSTLLPPARTLRDLHSSLTAHGARLSQLESKLRAVGAWDEATACAIEEGGGRMVIKWVTPRGHEGVGWTRRNLEQALGMWPGEERWFAIDEFVGTEMLPANAVDRDVAVESEPDTESLFQVDKGFSSLPTRAATPFEAEDEVDSPYDADSTHDAVVSTLRLPSPELPATVWSSLHSSVMSTMSASGNSSPAPSLVFGASSTFSSLMDTDGSDSPSWISYRQALRQPPPSPILYDLPSSDEEWASD